MSRVMYGAPLRQRGAVLILVLWVIMLLTLLLAAHSNNVRIETQIVKDMVAQLRLRAAAEGLINYLGVLNGASEKGLSQWEGQILNLEIDGKIIQYRLIPEESFISLNSAPSDLLTSLIAGLSENNAATESLVAAIIDWRDTDDITQADGAEARDYEALGFNYVPRDAPFQSMDELLLVMGMNRPLLDKLEPFLTVFSNSPGINAKFASPELIEIISGNDEALAEEILELRNNPDQFEFSFKDNELFSDQKSGIYRVQVQFSDNTGSGQPQTEITVSFATEGNLPYGIKKWNEYTARFDFAVE